MAENENVGNIKIAVYVHSVNSDQADALTESIADVVSAHGLANDVENQDDDAPVKSIVIGFGEKFPSTRKFKRLITKKKAASVIFPAEMSLNVYNNLKTTILGVEKDYHNEIHLEESNAG